MMNLARAGAGCGKKKLTAFKFRLAGAEKNPVHPYMFK